MGSRSRGGFHEAQLDSREAQDLSLVVEAVVRHPEGEPQGLFPKVRDHAPVGIVGELDALPLAGHGDKGSVSLHGGHLGFHVPPMEVRGPAPTHLQGKAERLEVVPHDAPGEGPQLQVPQRGHVDNQEVVGELVRGNSQGGLVLRSPGHHHRSGIDHPDKLRIHLYRPPLTHLQVRGRAVESRGTFGGRWRIMDSLDGEGEEASRNI